jgi:ABC-type thiamine transport system ATPase subunit
LDGSRLNGRENISTYLVDHFISSFSTINPSLDDNLSQLVVEVISDQENVTLCVTPDENEIFVAKRDLVSIRLLVQMV